MPNMGRKIVRKNPGSERHAVSSCIVYNITGHDMNPTLAWNPSPLAMTKWSSQDKGGDCIC